jgi:hypothetical protein
MKTASRSRVRRAARPIKLIWSALDYAKGRLSETRTGIDVERRPKRSQAELDALYAVPPSKRPMAR